MSYIRPISKIALFAYILVVLVNYLAAQTFTRHHHGAHHAVKAQFENALPQPFFSEHTCKSSPAKPAVQSNTANALRFDRTASTITLSEALGISPYERNLFYALTTINAP